MKLNVYKPMGLNDVYPRVLKELASVVAELLFIVFEKSWLLGKVPEDWKKETSLPFTRNE